MVQTRTRASTCPSVLTRTTPSCRVYDGFHRPGGGGSGAGELAAGGKNGGGVGGTGYYTGGGGGGVSGIKRVSDGTWLLVAGGGGGSGGITGHGGPGGSGVGGVAHSDAPPILGYEFDTQTSGEGGTQVRAGRGGVEVRALTFPEYVNTARCTPPLKHKRQYSSISFIL